MKPAEKARELIGELLSLAGWSVQDMDELNLGTSLGVAVREYPNKIFQILLKKKSHIICNITPKIINAHPH